MEKIEESVRTAKDKCQEDSLHIRKHARKRTPQTDLNASTFQLGRSIYGQQVFGNTLIRVQNC